MGTFVSWNALLISKILEVSLCITAIDMLILNQLACEIYTFNLSTPVCTVACNNFPYIRTVTFLNIRSNEWIEDFPPLQVGIWLVWGPKEGLNFCSCHIAKIKLHSIIVSEYLLKLRQCYLVWEIYLGDKIQDVKLKVWLDQIWSNHLQDLFSGRSSFCVY